MKPEEKDLLNPETGVEIPFDEDPVFRGSIIVVEANKGDDGYWTVLRTARALMSYDNETFFVREKSVKSLDKDLQRASDTTVKAINKILDEYEGDLWNKEEWDGMQYYMKPVDVESPVDRVLAEELHGIIEDVTNTKA